MDIKKFHKAVDDVLAAIIDPADNIKAIKAVLVKRPKAEIRQILHSYGRGPNSLIRQTPLQYAAHTRQNNAVKYLLDKHKLDVNQGAEAEDYSVCYRNVSHTAVGYAMLDNNSVLVKLLIAQYGASIHACPEGSPNLVHITCDLGNYAMAKFFIDRGAKIYMGVRSKSYVAENSFHAARTKTNISFIGSITSNKANEGSTRRVEESKTNISFTGSTSNKANDASTRRAEETITSAGTSTRILIEGSFVKKELSTLALNGSSTLAVDNATMITATTLTNPSSAEGVVERPGFMVAVEKGNEFIVKHFIARHVPINAQDRYMHTALHIAARTGQIAMAQLLLENGAKFTKDKYGLTPLHVACIYLQEAMVDFFLGYLEAEGNLAQEAKAETLELLGASLGIYSGYKYLSEAWKVRHNVEHIVQQKIVLAPQKCYDMQVEHETLKQLGGIYREEVECLTKHGNCNMYNERQEKESMIIKERILGVDNPYIALGLDRLMYHNMHSDRSERYFTFLVKQLQTLDQFYEEKSLVSVWIEIVLLLAQLPKMSSDLHYVRQLEKIAKSCAEIFIQEEVWVDYTLNDWKKDFEAEATVLDTVIERIVTAFFYVLYLVPETDDKLIEAKPMLQRFVIISNKLLSKGKCTKSAFHAMFALDIWQDFSEEVIIQHVTEMFRLLVKFGLNANLKDQNGNTPLHYAALLEKQWYTTLLINLLKQHKAHLDITNFDHVTPHQLYLSLTYQEIPEKPKPDITKRSNSIATSDRSKSRISNEAPKSRISNEVPKSRLSNEAPASKAKASSIERNKSRSNINDGRSTNNKSRATVDSRTKSRLSVVTDIQEDDDVKSKITDLYARPTRVRDKEIDAVLNPGVVSLVCMCARMVKLSNVKYKPKLNKKLRLQVLLH